MTYHVPERLNDDLTMSAIVHSASNPWTPSLQPGVERRFLEREGGEIARATTIVRYAPGSSFPAHAHDKGEEYFVLSGVFSDEHGDFVQGAYVRNPPGSTHAPFTKEGCVIFVKLRQMQNSDSKTVFVQTEKQRPEKTSIDGLSRIPLFESDRETVSVEIYEPATQWADRAACGGEEIYVIEGGLLYGGFEYRAGTWLRFPPGSDLPIKTKSGCRLWTKRGHL